MGHNTSIYVGTKDILRITCSTVRDFTRFPLEISTRETLKMISKSTFLMQFFPPNNKHDLTAFV